MNRHIATVLLFVVGLTGCGESSLEVLEEGSYLNHDPATLTQGLNAGQAGGCDTGIVNGLSNQLIEELNCIAPNIMVSFAGPSTRYGASVVPFLAPAAKNALIATAQAANDFITLNDAYRTVAQQYVLYRWWQQGRCGIQVAAAPGASNHQSGRAIDVQAWSFWNSKLAAHGWTWHGSSDVVHFDYLSAPQLGGKSVLAFQRLWNKNNSNKLVEDGVWGPASAGAMAASPVGGFGNHGCSAPPPPPTGTLKGIVYRSKMENPADVSQVIAGATVLINGKTLTTGADGAFTTPVPAGTHAVKVTAMGYEDGTLSKQVMGGQTVVANVGLTPKGMPDTEAPDLTLTSPALSSTSDVALITLNGTVSDAMGGAVTLTLAEGQGEAKGVMLASGAFAQQVTLKAGMNTLVLRATDAAGNVTTLTAMARFRAGLEGEVTTPDLRADPLEGILVTLLDAKGEVMASTQTGTDGRYAFELDTVPVHVSVMGEAPGYLTLVHELDVGADARMEFGFSMSKGKGTTDEPAPKPNEDDLRMQGGCSASPSGATFGLLALLTLAALRKRARRPAEDGASDLCRENVVLTAVTLQR